MASWCTDRSVRILIMRAEIDFQFIVIVFIIVSLVILWFSRTSLRDFRSHGFYRFFAWEAILVLILANFTYWFNDPFRFQQLVSWSLLVVSLVMVICGVYLLRVVGKPDRKRNDPSLIGIEKTTQLVTVGVYRYIRHPLYSSLLFLAWGAFFKHISWVSILSVGLATFFLIATARREEIENIRFFGPAYQSYMKRTRMFIPFLF